MVSLRLERTEGDYGFLAQDAQGHVLRTDSSRENGGLENGFRPMQALLAALGGCSGIDIVSILKKQRQQIDAFSIAVEGEREEGVVPAMWKRVHLDFVLTGAIEEEKARKACKLSIEKYCSVAETLRRAGASISWSVSVHHPIHTK
jgi:putative redox protein